MYLPRVTVLYSNGNLLADIAAIDGIAGIVATVVTPALIGAVHTVFNLADAETKGYTEAAEPFIYRHIKEFYSEVGGNQELWIMGTADTMTMADALDDTDETGAKKLIKAANGKIRVLGICHKPAAGYNPGADFFDADVAASLLAAKTFCDARLAELVPVRILVEGRVIDDTSDTIFQPKTANVGYAGVVVGGSKPDGSASVGAALGRAVKYAAHIKIGKVANGPLAIATVYIGSKALKDVLNLDALHGGGIISFMQHPNKAGFYFGVDRMASTDDYRLLAYGRVVDKAAIIAAAVYIEELESEVDVIDGKIPEIDIQHLQGRLEQSIKTGMGEQISSVSIYIDPTQNIINTSRLVVKLRIQPKGYTSFIDVDLGLNAPSAA